MDLESHYNFEIQLKLKLFTRLASNTTILSLESGDGFYDLECCHISWMYMTYLTLAMLGHVINLEELAECQSLIVIFVSIIYTVYTSRFGYA